MTKLDPLKGKEILRRLEQKGFYIARQKGSHFILRKDSKVCVVPVHGSKDVPVPTLVNIIKQSDLTEDEFLN